MEEKKLTETMENTAYETTSEPIFSDCESVKKTEKFPITKRDLIFAFLFLVSAFVFSAFGLWGGFKAGFTVSSLLFSGVVTAYLFKKDIKPTFFTVTCFVFSLLLSVIFSITSNSSVRFWGLLVLTVLSLIWFCSLVRKCEKDDYGLLYMIFAPIFGGALPDLIISISSLFTVGEKNRKKLGSVFLGVALAFPVLLVVVPLLISSDAAFSGFALKLISNVASSVLKIIVTLIITPFIISYCLSLAKREQKTFKTPEFKKAENTAVISFLSVLSLCYLAYLFSQLAYFFSAFSGFLPEDYSFTLSSYARRGFFEMCVIAAINFVIIFICILISAKKEGKICVATKALCTFIGFFTLVIISTALSKMFLYIKNFGMTELRITTSAFMLFLSVTFISLMVKIFVAKIRVFRVALVSAATVLTFLGIFNINSIIAGYNYNAYINGALKTVDVYAIYDLGDEGIPYLIKLAYDDDFTVSQTAKQRLTEVYTNGEYYESFYNENGYYDLGKKNYKGLEDFSFSKQKAYKSLDEYVKKNPEILIPEDYGESYEDYEDFDLY